MTNAITKIGNMGSLSFRVGTITATSSQTTEEVNTGMKTVVYMTVALANTTTAATTVPIVVEATPLAGKAVTVNFEQGTSTRRYDWFAIGYP